MAASTPHDALGDLQAEDPVQDVDQDEDPGEAYIEGVVLGEDE